MAPTARQLEEALIKAATSLFEADPDNVTVNMVRNNAAGSLSIEENFFTSAQWKTKSKDMIKGYVTQLHEGIVPEPKEPKDAKSAIKRRQSTQTPEELSPEPKRRKQAAMPKPKPRAKPKKEESDDEGTGEEEKFTPKAKVRGKTKVKKVNSDEEEDDAPKEKTARKLKAADSDDGDEKAAKRQAKVKGRALDSDSDSEGSAAKSIPVRKHEKGVKDEVKGEDSSEEDAKAKKAIGGGGNQTNITKESEPEDEGTPAAVKEDVPPADEEEEYSDVIDEPPKPKRAKKGEKAEKKEKTRKPSTASRKPAGAPASDDPNEAEIKKLQYQLTKCGTRKLWHNELKQYGADAKAKIRHLKKMLADVGMTGRFSEARAREIKEERELLADVEEAQKMNQLWGKAGGGRASRSKAKKELEEGEEGEDDAVNQDNGGDDEDEDTVFAARRRAQADLAFLGDESESD
ncbi:hypothetical protein N3K66_003134 [Trichothecium roseum]|uniref:Uncharacterized protein n=1 Tax=Trichothecium roseum TaxID=47278 RepID=A0ACC0V584_9HYPO|nr:hypothetical protein N3K66_003134 [Trichothecium roseum]